jgi:hypothetical protein
MKTMKKILFFVFNCVALSNLSTHCFSNDGNNWMRGAVIGGAAGGRKGLYAGMATGAVMDMGSQSRKRSRYDDDYYYDKRRNRKNSRSRRDLERENEELRQRLDELENE